MWVMFSRFILSINSVFQNLQVSFLKVTPIHTCRFMICKYHCFIPCKCEQIVHYLTYNYFDHVFAGSLNEMANDWTLLEKFLQKDGQINVSHLSIVFELFKNLSVQWKCSLKYLVSSQRNSSLWIPIESSSRLIISRLWLSKWVSR